ncbi:hypothetical protein VOLCADRAFT_117653 [Volvox carteri f. nagariensis]|uniref:tRNA:m(4)X modification enzyme TRM13 n=1 Tax=Volvox carteri f. nagariensis TaxID=3068 RepID=D8TWE5_VOLCA|nr:uncharacterized protein VOLCADRAFT_117653 [Volvox carteri f. nagariensis]EFJ48142.1 hypothetical protein VOLCADRAFT_117653 [Volvox carteri f. nagariensis]|eukprot:XP_002950827.1 hypothetical protein VOLCADRAFT_117653 [Volvox carteri f. nagariensis]
MSSTATATRSKHDNPEPGRCSFFLGGRKARFCRSLAVSGKRFCGNHLHVCDPSAAIAAPQRVPCPLDPNHTVLLSELELHVTKRCTALALAIHDRAQPHFLEDVNAGSDIDPDLPPPLPPPPPPPPLASTTAAAAAGVTAAAVAAAARGRAAQRSALARSLGEEAFMSLLARPPLPPTGVGMGVRVMRPSECEGMLSAPSQYRPFDLKHGLQQASIIGACGGAGVAVVEMGAGKGYLGATLAECCGVRRLVVTDVKSAFKHKPGNEDVLVPAQHTTVAAEGKTPGGTVVSLPVDEEAEAEAVTAAAAESAPFDPVFRIPRAVRMALGQKCKQLIDAGRLEWLQRRFRRAEMVSYIGPEVTGENRLLLAVHPVDVRQDGGAGEIDVGDGDEVSSSSSSHHHIHRLHHHI